MMTPTEGLRPELEAMPERIARLPISRGYPVPWFVAWLDGQPEFRAMDAAKFRRAILERLCWVCGEPLGRMMTFLIGPMCGVNRTTAEPPCHKECAGWSARNCPFLSKPHMVRRENDMPDMPEETCAAAGIAIMRNPGVTLLWTTRQYQTFDDGRGGVLFRIGDPANVEWWSKGKPASRAAVLDSVESGLPALQVEADMQPGASAHLARLVAEFQRFLPLEDRQVESRASAVPSET